MCGNLPWLGAAGVRQQMGSCLTCRVCWAGVLQRREPGGRSVQRHSAAHADGAEVGVSHAAARGHRRWHGIHACKEHLSRRPQPLEHPAQGAPPQACFLRPVPGHSTAPQLLLEARPTQHAARKLSRSLILFTRAHRVYAHGCLAAPLHAVVLGDPGKRPPSSARPLFARSDTPRQQACFRLAACRFNGD